MTGMWDIESLRAVHLFSFLFCFLTMLSFSIIYLHQGGKSSVCLPFTHSSAGVEFFLLPPKLPLGIKVDFVGRELHIPQGERKGKKIHEWPYCIYQHLVI